MNTLFLSVGVLIVGGSSKGVIASCRTIKVGVTKKDSLSVVILSAHLVKHGLNNVSTEVNFYANSLLFKPPSAIVQPAIQRRCIP